MKSRLLYESVRVIIYYAEKFSDSTSLHIQSQHFGGEIQILIEVVTIDYSNNDNIFREVNLSSIFNSYLSEDNNNYAPDTHTHMMNIYQTEMD